MAARVPSFNVMVPPTAGVVGYPSMVLTALVQVSSSGDEGSSFSDFSMPNFPINLHVNFAKLVTLA